MHPYSIENNDRFRILWIVVPFALVSAWILHNYVLTLIPHYQDYRWIITAPTSALALGFVYYKWMEKDLWCRLNNWYGFVKTPDLSGEYQGTLKSSRDDFDSETEITVNIEQSLRKMLLTLSTTTSSSKSEMAAILPNEIDGPRLIYSYYSDHKKVSKPDMEYHRGMGKLTLNLSESKLYGTYFASPERGYYGEIQLFMNE
ncbi:MAG: hypothetical protein ACQETE_02570 [Bacteroidota bacterium]